jgi:hypothetical protein
MCSFSPAIQAWDSCRSCPTGLFSDLPGNQLRLFDAFADVGVCGREEGRLSYGVSIFGVVGRLLLPSLLACPLLHVL